MHRTLLLLALAALAGCGGAAPPASDLSSSGSALRGGADGVKEAEDHDFHQGERRQSLLATDRQLIDSIHRLGPADGIRPFLGREPTYLAPRQPLAIGEDHVEAVLAAAFPPAAETAQEWEQFSGAVSSDGKFGYTFGHGTHTTTAADGSRNTLFALYIAVWRPHAHGWRLETYLWNLQLSDPGSPPAGFPLFDPGVSGAPRRGSAKKSAEEVLAADTAFAQLSLTDGYSMAFAEYVAPEGAQMASPIAWGGDAVAAAFAGWTPVETLAWTPVLARSTVSGDLGWSVGNALYTLRDDTGAIIFQSPSKYLTIWARQPDGRWKYILDGGNSRPLLPP
jgi:ketosteroid isomerase-like protein